MVNELLMYDYMIALIEAAKKATKRLRKKKAKKILEEGPIPENVAKDILLNAFGQYLGERGVLKAIVNRVKELVGTEKTVELYSLLFGIADLSDKFVKPENLYLLKPALDIMQDFLRKCEKIEKGEKLEGSNVLNQEICNEFKSTFKQFIEKYELTKKDTPFYKRWYYWFLSLPMWKRLLIGFLLLVVVFIILLVVFKVGRKVAGALKRALNGDKTVGKKLVAAASNASSSVKTAAFSAVIGATKKAALYL